MCTWFVSPVHHVDGRSGRGYGRRGGGPEAPVPHEAKAVGANVHVRMVSLASTNGQRIREQASSAYVRTVLNGKDVGELFTCGVYYGGHVGVGGGVSGQGSYGVSSNQPLMTWSPTARLSSRGVQMPRCMSGSAIGILTMPWMNDNIVKKCTMYNMLSCPLQWAKDSVLYATYFLTTYSIVQGVLMVFTHDTQILSRVLSY